MGNILSFESRYPEVVIHKLEINWRSHDRIVKAAKKLIEKNNPRLNKSIRDKGVPSQDGDLYKLTFVDQEEEIEWIVEKVKQLAGTEYTERGQVRKLKYSDFAVLFRSLRNEAPRYIDALKRAGIPIVYSGVGGLFETIEVNAIIKVFEYISKIDGNAADGKLDEIYNFLPDSFSISVSRKDFKAGISNLEEWARSQKRLSIQGLYGKLLQLLGVARPEFHEEEDEILLFNLGRLSNAITDYEISREYITFNGLKSFLWFLRLHCDRSYDSGQTDATAHLIDAVQILTFHGTKGLGFPVVFIPGNHKPKRSTKPNPTWINICGKYQ